MKAQTDSDPAMPAAKAGSSDDGYDHPISRELAAYGIVPLPKRGGVVTMELVNRLRDDEPAGPTMANPNALTHFDAQGQAHMVDVGHKPPMLRTAIARGSLQVAAATLAIIEAGTAKKGDVLGVARIAGIQAAKRCGELIPLCHPLALTHVAVEFALSTTEEGHGLVSCTATVKTVGATGVEMEALCAVQIALLTVYDMCKAVDKAMVLRECLLVEKTKTPVG